MPGRRTIEYSKSAFCRFLCFFSYNQCFELKVIRVSVNVRADGGTRRGNMGHLTRIANMVVQNLEKGPVQTQISDLIRGIYTVVQCDY